MLFSYPVSYRAIASRPLFRRFLTAGCGDIDPCTPCICERLSTPCDEGYARSMMRGSTTLKNAVEGTEGAPFGPFRPRNTGQIPRSERCSYPFSDSFMAKFAR